MTCLSWETGKKKLKATFRKKAGTKPQPFISLKLRGPFRRGTLQQFMFALLQQNPRTIIDGFEFQCAILVTRSDYVESPQQYFMFLLFSTVFNCVFVYTPYYFQLCVQLIMNTHHYLYYFQIITIPEFTTTIQKFKFSEALHITRPSQH